MSSFFLEIGDLIYSTFEVLNNFTFELGGFKVSWLGLMFAFLVVSLAMGFLWKGGNE